MIIIVTGCVSRFANLLKSLKAHHLLLISRLQVRFLYGSPFSLAGGRQTVKAGVAKLAYARDLGSRGRETVRVQVPPSAPFKNRRQKAEGSEQ